MIQLENDILIAEIALVGAELKRLYNKETKMDYMWNANPAYWGRTSPVLFPIVGRLKENTYVVNEKEYELSQHGFARDMAFDVLKQARDSVTLVLRSNEDTITKYPYVFELHITYTLVGDKIDVMWNVKNAGEEKMYFSIGGHPAFNVPMTTDTNMSDYKLKLECEEKVHNYTLEGPFVKEKVEIQKPTTINVDAAYFVNDAVIYDNVQAVSIVSDKHEHAVTVTFKGFPYVGIWSPYNAETNEIAPFICIEPWYGIADTVEATGDMTKKMGIQSLEKGHTFQSVYSISVK